MNDSEIKILNKAIEEGYSNELYNFSNQVLKMAKFIINMKDYNIVENTFSKVDLNTSINLVYKFLLSMDNSLANEYLNIIKDSSVVEFIPKKKIDGGSSVSNEGHVKIYYANTYEDAFVILHEMLHKLNKCDIIEDNKVKETDTRKIFGETVSIMGEDLLGQYLVRNNIISKQDYNNRIKRRIISTKHNASVVIVENTLMYFYKKGIPITQENILSYINSCKDSTTKVVLETEYYKLSNIEDILINYQEYKNNKKHKEDIFNTTIDARYVIALACICCLRNKKNYKDIFLKMNYLVGSVNTKVSDITKGIV